MNLNQDALMLIGKIPLLELIGQRMSTVGKNLSLINVVIVIEFHNTDPVGE